MSLYNASDNNSSDGFASSPDEPPSAFNLFGDALSSGIPIALSDVSKSDSDDLIYKNIAVANSYSVPLSVSRYDLSAHTVVRPEIFGLNAKTPAARPVIVSISRPLGKHHVVFGGNVQEARRQCESYLTTSEITNRYRCEADTHSYTCVHVSSKCQLLRFTVLVFPSQDSSVVEFRRDRGSEGDLLTTLFDDFQKFCGMAPQNSNSNRRKALPLLGDDDCCPASNSAEMQNALSALSTWIDSSPTEALQCIGQMCCSSSRHVLESANVFTDICRSIEASANAGDADLTVLTLALCCLRVFLVQASELSIVCPFTTELSHIVREGAIAAIETGSQLTAKREALATIKVINSIVSLEHKIELAL